MSTEGPKSRNSRTPRQSDRFPMVKRTEAQVLTREELSLRWKEVQHSTRNLINPAIMALDGVLKYDLPKEKSADYINKAKLALERLYRLIQETDLDQEHRLRIEEINLLNLCEEVNAQTQGKGNVKVVIDPSLDIFIEGDRSKLADVITNLVLNVHDAVQDKPIMVYIRAQQSEYEVQISLYDDGPGIPLSIRDRLFSFGATTKDQDSETHGIGLFSAQRQIRLHNGTLKLLSTVTKEELPHRPQGTYTGTSFVMSLPKRQIVEELETEKSLRNLR